MISACFLRLLCLACDSAPENWHFCVYKSLLHCYDLHIDFVQVLEVSVGFNIVAWCAFYGLVAHQGPQAGIAALIGFAVQAKSVRFESVKASTLQTLPFNFNPGDARVRRLLDRGVLTTPPSCRYVGAQSSTKPWYTEHY